VKLYSYFRSSAAYRVRIGLELKGLEYQVIPVDLRAGEQHRPAYTARQPQGLVPLLEDGDLAIGQSLAILEYLDEVYPEPPLLPERPGPRARVRQFCGAIAADTHPLCNLRVLHYLERELGAADAQRAAWYRHWVAAGLASVEQMLTDPASQTFCHGDAPTLADACLVPQVYNARRFDCPLTSYPRILEIEARCVALPPFARAAPERQPDAHD